MGECLNIESRIIQAERRWHVTQFTKKGKSEASSCCPFCHQGVDRFIIFQDGGYWCRQCNVSGWLDDDKPPRKLTEQEKLNFRVAALERKQRENEQRLSKLERMARCTDHLRYHQNITDGAMAYWFGEGIFRESIDRYLLGYCPKCPTDVAGRPSYTIPVKNGGKLENIRHRLVGAESDKYRPHMAGLGTQLFNADVLDDTHDSVIIAEGEKKVIVLDQCGFRAVGISGKRNFKREWLKRFDGIRTVYVALDPDATASAYRLAALFGGRGRVVQTPVKIDDMIVQYGAGADDVEAFLHVARSVDGK